MKKILVAVDGSEGSLRAVDYVGRQFAGMEDLRITLFHVLPYVPTSFWDDGHVLTTEERRARQEVVDKWIRNQQLNLDPIFQSAKEVLVKKGIPEARIDTKGVSDSADVAETILEEVSDGGYQTLVLGRRGLSPAKRLFMGSVTSEIINRGTGTAICVVE
jgi:nucleotide-binding universal stress UspA family protein